MKRKVSIVVSAYDEESNIPQFFGRLSSALAGLPESFEIIFVDDGSSDATLGKMIECRAKDGRVKIIALSRNFGYEIAMTAGMDAASGDAVLFMDADLQHPPEIVPGIVERWRRGAAIVLTNRTDNESTGPAYKFLSSCFYGMFNFLSDIKLPKNMSNFRLIDRKFVDFLKQFEERDRILRGLLAYIAPAGSSKVAVIDFIAPKRASGKSRFGLWRSFQLAVSAITSFSTKPLKMSFWFGLVAAFASVLVGLHAIFEYFYYGLPMTGYTTTIAVIAFIGAVQLIMLGIVGEYIGKIHLEVKKRPLYFADVVDGENKDKR